MKQIIKYIVLIFCVANIQAQNLVRNPSFEDYANCDYYSGLFDSVYYNLVPYWTNANKATPDYLNVCNTDPSGLYTVPNGRYGYQIPRTGNAMMGFFAFNNVAGGSTETNDYREYIQTKLSMPLVANKVYKVKFYVSCSSNFGASWNFGAVDDIGAYFSENRYYQDDFNYLSFPNPPQVNSQRGIFLNDTTNWTLIEGCYRAKGGEQWLTIGNFTPTQYVVIDTLHKDSISTKLQAYYVLDDVSVEENLSFNFQSSSRNVCSIGNTSISGRIGYANYTWNNGEISQSIIPATSGMYIVSSTRANCEIALDTFNVTVTDNNPIPEPNIIQCGGNNIIIRANSGYAQYRWSTGSTNSFILVSDGTYYLTATDYCGNEVVDTVTASNATNYLMDIPSNVTVCNQSSYVIRILPNFYGPIWDNNVFLQSDTLLVTQSSIHTIRVNNVCGVNSYDTVNVRFVNTTPFALPPDKIECNATSTITAPAGFANYQWNTGANTQNINVSQSGNYICTATNACGELVRDSIQITFIADVQLELGDNIITCAPNHTITAPAGFTSYAWNNGNTTPQLNVTQSGNYSLTASTPCGSKSDNVQITFKTPPTLQIPETEYLCTTASKTITATGNFDQIHWSNGNTTPQITITEGGTYTATASNYCGQIRKSIAVDTCTRHYSIYIPNAFTPNGDNINDELKVYGNNIQLKTLAIYNRWGEKLFETNDINKGWDGIHSDEPLPADTYVYYVEIVTPSKEEVIKRKGDVLLIR